MTLGTLLLTALLAAGGGEPQLTPAQESRAQHLGKELRCAVCQGLSITDSPSATARSQLQRVRELILEGKTDQEIRDYFVARYGEWALLNPPTHGVSILGWLGPALFVAIGLGLIAWVVRRGKQARMETPSTGVDAELPEVES